MEDDANDYPLPMRISVANIIDQEGCFVTLKEVETFRCEDYQSGVALMLSPDL
jgi:hypothetical protein